MYEWKDKTTQKLYSHDEAAKGSTLNTVGEIWGKLANYQPFIGFRFTPFHCLRHPLNCKKMNTRTGKWTLFSITANSTTRMYSSRAFIWVGHTFRFPLKENELSTFWICKKMNPDQHIIGSCIQCHPKWPSQIAYLFNYASQILPRWILSFLILHFPLPHLQYIR